MCAKVRDQFGNIITIDASEVGRPEFTPVSLDTPLTPADKISTGATPTFQQPVAPQPSGATPAGGSGEGGSSTSSTLNDTLNRVLEGISTPMTIEEIRAQEAAAREARRIQAESLFNPKIAQARETGEQNVGSGKAQVGVSRGLGLSSAEIGFINSLKKQADDRVREIEQQKEAYISQGDFQAAERADKLIMEMSQMKNNLLLQTANLALQLAQEQRVREFGERELDISEQRLEFERQAQELNQEIALGQITGTFRGAPTFEAEQAAINNALQIANLTGEFMGAPTFAAKRAVIEDAFTQAGIDLQKQSLEETIRSNKVQEELQRKQLAISAAKAKGESGAETIFGKKISSREPMFNQGSGQYIGDRITFADGTTTFVNPAGTMTMNVTDSDLANIRFGNPGSFNLAQSILDGGSGLSGQGSGASGGDVSATVQMKSPDGQVGPVAVENIQAALAAGYQYAQ